MHESLTVWCNSVTHCPSFQQGTCLRSGSRCVASQPEKLKGINHTWYQIFVLVLCRFNSIRMRRITFKWSWDGACSKWKVSYYMKLVISSLRTPINLNLHFLPAQAKLSWRVFYLKSRLVFPFPFGLIWHETDILRLQTTDSVSSLSSSWWLFYRRICRLFCN